MKSLVKYLTLLESLGLCRLLTSELSRHLLRRCSPLAEAFSAKNLHLKEITPILLQKKISVTNGSVAKVSTQEDPLT